MDNYFKGVKMIKERTILSEFNTQRVKCLDLCNTYEDALSDYHVYEADIDEYIDYLEAANAKYLPNKEAQITKAYEADIDEYYIIHVSSHEAAFKAATKKLIDIFYKLVDQYKEDIPKDVYDLYNDYKKIIDFNYAKRVKFIDLLMYEVLL